MSLQVSTNAFAPGGIIPKKFACSGEDVSPGLAWTVAPSGTQSILLIVDDPDAPAGTWTHWLVYDLPPAVHELPEGVPHTPDLKIGGHQGKNDFGKTGYNGPCPPPGKPHHYYFRVFALDRRLNLPAGAGRKAIDREMRGHVLAEGEVMGSFGR